MIKPIVKYQLINNIPIKIIYSTKIKKKYIFRIDKYWNSIYLPKYSSFLAFTLNKALIAKIIAEINKQNPYNSRENSLYVLGNKFNIEFENRKYFKYILDNDKKNLFFYFDLSKQITTENLILKFSKKELNSIANNLFKKILINYPEFKNINIELNIKYMNSKWGICRKVNFKNYKISLNSFLIHYPIEYLCYVIHHELCHIFYANHSKFFWQKVQEKMANYKYYYQTIKKYEF